ncbi:LacI family transcriptional regulator [Lactobacillus halodurans]|uniref:LacI family transcriptional regulator n=1 Tax=Companilactobacillus halodurans TaxID=2584183 RepID=A0A5P0ZR34_9LACO|nr:LacI family DNA-binding transcriptional regulator [Companilactobacillus halodurans]MQS76717.1 LacI family transcriptional regulator [Companilactobacillus halodurans]
MSSIEDVAKLAGVSTTTVSRALNNKSYVSEKTKLKIEKVVKELNYVPNKVARSLSSKRTNIIGVIVPSIIDPVYSEEIDTIERVLNKNGLRILLYLCPRNSKQYELELKNMLNSYIDGIISAVYDFPVTVAEENVPFVQLGGGKVDYSRKVNVITDDYKVGQAAVKLIEGSNRKRVIVQHGPLSLSEEQDRLDAIVYALNGSQVDYELQLVNQDDPYGIEGTQKLFAEFNDFDAVLARNDQNAYQVILEAKRRKIMIPKELKVIGYGGPKFLGNMSSLMTSISINPTKIGKTVANLMISLLDEEKKQGNQQITVPIVIK